MASNTSINQGLTQAGAFKDAALKGYENTKDAVVQAYNNPEGTWNSFVETVEPYLDDAAVAGLGGAFGYVMAGPQMAGLMGGLALAAKSFMAGDNQLAATQLAGGLAAGAALSGDISGMVVGVGLMAAAQKLWPESFNQINYSNIMEKFPSSDPQVDPLTNG